MANDAWEHWEEPTLPFGELLGLSRGLISGWFRIRRANLGSSVFTRIPLFQPRIVGSQPREGTTWARESIVGLGL